MESWPGIAPNWPDRALVSVPAPSKCTGIPFAMTDRVRVGRGGVRRNPCHVPYVTAHADLALHRFTVSDKPAMLNSVDTFDVPTRVRELELSINRRVREALQPFIGDSATLEATSREILLISRDYAGSFQAITNRARIRREREGE